VFCKLGNRNPLGQFFFFFFFNCYRRIFHKPLTVTNILLKNTYFKSTFCVKATMNETEMKENYTKFQNDGLDL
jgi:hypothetical protein